MRRLPSVILIFIFCCMMYSGWSQTPETIADEARVYSVDTVSVVGRRAFRPLGADSAALTAEIRRMLKDDQKYRSNKRTFSTHLAAQRAIDSANTLRMIEIIRAYGFPSNERFNQTEGLMLPHIILVHAPELLFDTLRTMLLAERQAGRMTTNEYAHVLWQLDGRRSHPALEGGTTKYKRGGRKMVHRTAPRRGGKEVF